jgi:hypothetical protein
MDKTNRQSSSSLYAFILGVKGKDPHMVVDVHAGTSDSAAAHNDPVVFAFDSTSMPFNSAFTHSTCYGRCHCPPPQQFCCLLVAPFSADVRELAGSKAACSHEGSTKSNMGRSFDGGR